MKSKNKIIPYIKYESVLKGVRNIEERNKIFNALDAQSQRLEMAWDALQLIVSGKVKSAGKGKHYWSNSLDIINDNCSLTPSEFQKKLIKNLPACSVCARGAIMVSRIRLGNNLLPGASANTQGDDDTIVGFRMTSLYAMESEYEGSAFCHPYASGSVEKLVNILCNILINGDFNTDDQTDYLKPYYK